MDAKGRSAYRDWLIKFDTPGRARLITATLRMEAGNVDTAKSVGRGVLEMRLEFGPGYRIYFGRHGEQLIILLCGGSKRNQQADIDAAQKHWADYKKRKREKQ